MIERDHFFGVEEESRGQPDDGVRVEASKEISTVAEVQIDLLSVRIVTYFHWHQLIKTIA